ncbi:MAG: hypothetical protein EAX87_06080 [Candidatus Thorarchaeota archaeon]|nr:hypothetical protein [Candidatus Thorarchaeota archaeon]
MRFNSANTVRNLILLLVLALFTPAVIGFQYLEWRDSSHLFFGVMGSTWAILYSDWYLNDWLIILLPNIIVLIPRVLFVITLIGFNLDRVGLNLVRTFGLILIGIEIIICLVLMSGNVIYGTLPGVLISILAPDVNLRLFVPTPLLLLVGAHQVLRTRTIERRT